MSRESGEQSSQVTSSDANLLEEFGLSVLEAVHHGDRDAVIFFASDGIIRYANEAALRLFRMDNSIIGENYLDIRRDEHTKLGVDLSLDDHHVDLVRSAMQGEPQRGEFLVVDDTTEREIEVLYGPVHRDGALVGIIASYRDVSEWRRINALTSRQARELEEERQFLTSVLEVMDDGLFVFDSDLRLKLCNPAAARMLAIDDLPRQTKINDLLASSDLLRPGLLEEQLTRAARSGEATAGIHVVDHGDDLRGIEFNTVQTGLERRELICTLKDITDWQQLQQVQLLADLGRLSAEKTRTDELATWLLDAIFDTLNVDIAVLALLERERLHPVAWRGLMLETEMSVDPMENSYVQEALDTGVPVEGDGSEWEGPSSGELTGAHFVVPLTFSGTTLGTLHLGALQSVRLFGGPDREYTDPAASFDRLDSAFLAALGSHAAAALQNVRLLEDNVQERARLRTSIERIPEGIVLFNARGEILVSNSAAKRIAGIEWKNLNTESRPYRVCDADGKPLPRGEWPFFRAVRTGESFDSEVLIFDYGAYKRHIEVTVAPVPSFDGQVPSFVGTLQDVTERSEQERRKDEFLSVASHELRSPLTPLTGFLQMLRRQVETGQEIDPLLVERAEKQVSRLSRLIDGLLDMTRIETGRMLLNLRRIDLAELLERVVEPWYTNTKEIHFEFDLPEEGLEATLDPDRIDQVLTNVIDNAVKHSEDGGDIDIELRRESNDACVTIRDQGTGIDQETLDHIFERFYRGQNADRHPGSMGLGLYITREIIEQHGGDIDIDSVEGVHTTVTIRLPIEPH